jgi:hypothetical protein
MKTSIEELQTRIGELQEELEAQYDQLREEFARKREELAGRFLDLQRRNRIGLWQYIRHSRWPVVLTAPLIYSGWIAFALMDAFVSLFQAVCFPVYGIPKVRRADHLVFDRGDLPYLNAVEKFNCFYCSYGNGVAAYARAVAARTEQYWCPIKHARRMQDTHPLYPRFFEHGDAEAYRQGLERMRALLDQGDQPTEEPGPPKP